MYILYINYIYIYLIYINHPLLRPFLDREPLFLRLLPKPGDVHTTHLAVTHSASCIDRLCCFLDRAGSLSERWSLGAMRRFEWRFEWRKVVKVETREAWVCALRMPRVAQVVNVSRRRSLSMISMSIFCSIIAEKLDTGLPKLFVGRHDHQRDVRDDTAQL